MKVLMEELQQKISYHFQDEELLLSALMHSSYTNEMHMPKFKCNERLEFLGDAVLELVSSEFLFFEDGKMPEGMLTRTRASLVCEPSLAFCANQIQLGKYLLMGKGEEATGGRKRDSIVSDALEALIGAIYLDGGFASAKEFIQNFVLNDLEHKKLFYDSKTILQEIVQAHFHEPVSYEIVREEGPDHDKTFFARVNIGQACFGEGQGKTKKAAEQEAAYRTILELHKKNKK